MRLFVWLGFWTFPSWALGQVTLPNGSYSESVEDLRVTAPGGAVLVTRQYLEGRWQVNARWNSLNFSYDPLDGSVKTIIRNGSSYERVGDGWLRDGQNTIRRNQVGVLPTAGGTLPPIGVPGIDGQALRTVTGYRWMNRIGDWIHYDDEGRMTAYGNRANITVWFQYGADGRLRYVLDHFGRVLLRYFWNGEQLQRIEDVPTSWGENDAVRVVTYRYKGQSTSQPTYPLLTEVVDVRGGSTRYEYSGDKLSAITDQEGRVRHFDYIGDRITRVTEADGNQTTYSYDYDKLRGQFYVRVSGPQSNSGQRVEETWFDSQGRLIRRDLNGETQSTAQYDPATRTEISMDALGRRTQIKRDDNGNVLQIVLADGSRASAVWSSMHGQKLEETDATGVKTKYDYDAQGRLTKLTEASGTAEETITDWTWNERGQVMQMLRRGKGGGSTATNYGYDEFDNVTSVTDGEGRVWRYRYNRQGLTEEIRDANGAVWLNRYDAAGNLIIGTDANGSTATYRYDQSNRLIASVDSLGRERRIGYDARGRFATELDPAGGQWSMKYGSGGRLSRLEDAVGSGTNLEYDALGRATRVKDSRGNAMEMRYGGAGSLPHQVSQIVFPTYQQNFQRDVLGRITSLEILADGITRSQGYRYDVAGQLLEIRDAYDHTTRFEHDALGRLTKVSDALGREIHYGYDAANGLVSLTDAKRNLIQLTRDRSSKVLSLNRPSGEGSRLEYDLRGNLTVATDALGQRKLFNYDAAGRHVRTEAYGVGANSPGQIQEFSYDAAGHMVAWHDGQHSGTLEYDLLGRLLRETVNYGAFSLTHGYGYAANDRRTTLVYPDGLTLNYRFDQTDSLIAVDIGDQGSLLLSEYTWLLPRQESVPGGVSRLYDYDGLHQPQTVRIRGPDEIDLARFEYSYGKLGEITRSNEDGQTAEYDYDAVGRLVRAGSTRYVLDLNNNRLSENGGPTWAYDANNRLISSPWGQNRYDANGNLVEKRTGEQITRYRYDLFNRLIQVENGDGTVVARYGYDPFDRRLWKEVAGQRTYFHYGQDGLLAEANESGQITTLYGWQSGSWQAQPLFIRQGQSYIYLHGDTRGTPRLATDNTGQVVWRGQFSIFGRLTAQQGQFRHALRLPGQYEDLETGLHYNGRRYYDPDTGRYLSEDPIGYVGGLNLYGYTGHDPVNWVDPTGENPAVILVPVGIVAAKGYACCVVSCQAFSMLFEGCLTGQCFRDCLELDNLVLGAITCVTPFGPRGGGLAKGGRRGAPKGAAPPPSIQSPPALAPQPSAPEPLTTAPPSPGKSGSPGNPPKTGGGGEQPGQPPGKGGGDSGQPSDGGNPSGTSPKDSSANGPGSGAGPGGGRDIPDKLVGLQDNKSRKQGKRVNNGVLAPENGGTGNAQRDFEYLTGGRYGPPPSNKGYPEGTLIGDNEISLRPPSGVYGPRIDIPRNGTKPPETLHY